MIDLLLHIALVVVILLSFGCLAKASAQVFVPPPSPADVINAATAQGLIPSPCPAGAPTGSTCYLTPPAVQAVKTMTDSNAHWKVVWAQAFNSVNPFVVAIPVDNSAQPMFCRVSSATSTSAEGDCYTNTKQTTTGVALGATTTVTSAIVPAAANVDVRVAARETTQ